MTFILVFVLAALVLAGGLAIYFRKPKATKYNRVELRPPSTRASWEQLSGRTSRKEQSVSFRKSTDTGSSSHDDGLANNLVMFAAIDSLSTPDPTPSYSAPESSSYSSDTSSSYGGSSYDSGSSYYGGSSSGGGSGSDF